MSVATLTPAMTTEEAHSGAYATPLASWRTRGAYATPLAG